MTGYAKSETAVAVLGGRKLAAACVAGMLIGLAGAEAGAADVVTANRIYAGCQLSSDTLALLRADIQKDATATAFGIGNPEVDVVVVYRFDQPNWGQPIFEKSGNTQVDTGLTTARVLCAAPGVFGTHQPTDEDDRFPSSGDVTVRNADETLGFRVQGISGSDIANGQFAAKFCLTATPGTNESDTIDCVRYKLPQ